MGKDTRRFQRYRYIATARVSREGREGPAVTVMVHNLSQAGMGIFSETPFEPGEDVSVTFNFITVEGEEVTDSVRGRITGVTEKEGLYYAGIAFRKELDPSNQPHLFELFHRCIKEQ